MGAAVMGGEMAATGAVSGMPVAAAAPVPSAFLPGATERSHRLGSRPAPARPRAPEPPPGAPSLARPRSLSPLLEISLPSPLAGMATGHRGYPQLGPAALPTAQLGPSGAPGDTPQEAGAHLLLLFLLHEFLQLRAAAFPLSSCAEAPLPPPLTLRPPQANIPMVSGWPDTSGGLRRLRCPSAVVASLSPSAGGTLWAGVVRWRCGRRPSPAQTRDFPQGERLNCSFQGFGI